MKVLAVLNILFALSAGCAGMEKNARDAKLRHVRYGKFLRARVHGGRGRLRAMRVGDTGV